MKHLPSLLLAVTTLVLLSTSCRDVCERTVTYIKYVPIFKAIEEFRIDPTVEGPMDLKNPGKIYSYGSTLLINEILEGVHVIDNSNPSAPIHTAFIRIPGNKDIAMRGNTLYADSYIDLLAIDISDLQNIRLTKRVEDAFPYHGIDPVKGLLVDYKEEEVTETVDCNEFRNRSIHMTMDANSGVGMSGGGAGRENIGIGGSMARFAINNQVLYIVDESSLHVYSIVNPAIPNYTTAVNVGRGIETIFPYREHLFIGSTEGMFIYNNTDPQNPTYTSEFQHATACDPVFVQGNFAYVTLRGGTPCNSSNNQLDIIDVSDINNPTLVSTTGMTHPHGVSVDNDELYLCEGDAGLKVFDISNKQNLRQLSHETGMAAYDAIKLPNANIVMVVGKDGFYQYDNSDPNNLQLLSHIEVAK